MIHDAESLPDQSGRPTAHFPGRCPCITAAQRYQSATGAPHGGETP